MNTKNTLFLISALVLILIAGFYFLTSESDNTEAVKKESTCPEVKDTKVVEMAADSFRPETLTIQKCTRVVFENKDTKAHWPASNIHPIHGIYPEFDPQRAIAAGESWSFTFDQIGNWRYHDHLTPSTSGEITVTE